LCDLQDRDTLDSIFSKYKPQYVVNLAAQAGVRYSIENPHAYTETNITGFLNILENSKKHEVKHLVFASSSSVYGMNQQAIFAEGMNTEHPLSMYAATKKANEMMAHAYSSLFGMAVTGLRFFTVYGPWGRPDMALFMFTKNILEGETIDVYNHGNMQRDFTYVDDIVESVFRLLSVIPVPKPEGTPLTSDSSLAPYEIYNVGNGSPSQLMDYVGSIENELSLKAKINFMPLQAGDVPKTFANTDKLFNATGFRPNTRIQDGIKNFVAWYRDYYGV
jgi:UDP-glucuronate 4-epimerase